MNQNNNDSSIQVKIVFSGDSFVGKTSLAKKYANGEFESIYTPTIGVDFAKNITTKQNRQVKILLWDIGQGGERFRSITNVYYKDSKAVVFVYDITNRSTFQSLFQRMEEIQQINQPYKKIYALVGQKYDLKQDRQVSINEAQQLADSLGMIFFEVSAKTSHNINLFFDRLIDHIITI